MLGAVDLSTCVPPFVVLLAKNKRQVLPMDHDHKGTGAGATRHLRPHAAEAEKAHAMRDATRVMVGRYALRLANASVLDALANLTWARVGG